MGSRRQERQGGHLLRRFALFLVAAVSIFMIASMALQPSALAAELSDNIATRIEFINTATGRTITDMDTHGKYQINVDFKIPNNARSGDTSTVTLPNELKFLQPRAFDIIAANGAVVAKAAIDPTSKKLIFTYTDYVDDHADITGKIAIPFEVDTGVIKQEKTIPATVDIGGTSINKGTIHFKGFTADSSDEQFAKWGRVYDSSRNEITYYIRLNARGDNLKNVSVTDKVSSFGMEIDPSSFSVTRTKFVQDENGSWIQTNNSDMTADSVINVSADRRSFTATVGDLNGFGAMLTYTVKLNHKPLNSELFVNQARAEADGKEMGTTETSRFVWQFASGEANGYQHSIQIRKVDESGQPLAGAVFAVTRDSSGEVVATVTTDASGSALVPKLLRDNYSITETAAPAGYQLDTTPVKVTADELNGASKTVVKTVINRKTDENPHPPVIPPTPAPAPQPPAPAPAPDPSLPIKPVSDPKKHLAHTGTGVWSVAARGAVLLLAGLVLIGAVRMRPRSGITGLRN